MRLGLLKFDLVTPGLKTLGLINETWLKDTRHYINETFYHSQEVP